jgi:hypothetical protein
MAACRVINNIKTKGYDYTPIGIKNNSSINH